MAEMKKQTEFKLYKRDSVFFDQNTAPVNIAYAHEVNDVAILPLGAIEQHGPHCPNGLDSFNAICQEGGGEVRRHRAPLPHVRRSSLHAHGHARHHHPEL